MKMKIMKSRQLVLVWMSAFLTCVPLTSSSSLAQSLWPFGDNREQEKMQSQRQAPVERTFSENYWKLTEKQRALAGDKYAEYLKQQKGRSTSDASQDESKRKIKSLNAPDNPFQ